MGVIDSVMEGLDIVDSLKMYTFYLLFIYVQKPETGHRADQRSTGQNLISSDPHQRLLIS